MKSKSDEKEWTVMVYMAGDNNLSVDMAYALEQIKSVARGSMDKVNLLAYYDGFSPDIPTLYCDFSAETEDRIFFQASKIERLYGRKYKRTQNENSAAASSVINFVNWCVNGVSRRAKNYALIFSGHSTGFHSIGLFRDETSDYYMTMPKLRWLLERITSTGEVLEREAKSGKSKYDDEDDDIRTTTTEILGQQLAILGFDSCLMGMLEVGYQFQPYAQTMIASEGSIPNAGWTYAELLGDLVDQNRTPADVAKAFVKSFVAKYDAYTIGGTAVDMAAWNLEALPTIDEPLAQLTESLLDCFKDADSVLYKQMKRVLLDVHWRCQSYMFEQNVDVVDFCFMLMSEMRSLRTELPKTFDTTLEEISERCLGVIDQVQKIVLLAGFSGGKYQYSNGISLFFPWSISGYGTSAKCYRHLDFVENTTAGKQWNEFLIKYLGEVSLRPGKKVSNGALPGNVINFKFLDFLGDSEETTYYSYAYRSKDEFGPDDDPLGIASVIRAATSLENRTPVNPENRTPVNPENRTPVNSENRTPVNPENRMIGSLGVYFEQLFLFKNIRWEWNISGFTRNPNPNGVPGDGKRAGASEAEREDRPEPPPKADS